MLKAVAWLSSSLLISSLGIPEKRLWNRAPYSQFEVLRLSYFGSILLLGMILAMPMILITKMHHGYRSHYRVFEPQAVKPGLRASYGALADDRHLFWVSIPPAFDEDLRS